MYLERTRPVEEGPLGLEGGGVGGGDDEGGTVVEGGDWAVLLVQSRQERVQAARFLHVRQITRPEFCESVNRRITAMTNKRKETTFRLSSSTQEEGTTGLDQSCSS